MASKENAALQRDKTLQIRFQSEGCISDNRDWQNVFVSLHRGGVQDPRYFVKRLC